MGQIEISFRLSGISTHNRELLPYWLESIGFEGFQDTHADLLAYISSDRFNRKALVNMLQDRNIAKDCYTETHLPDKNWNEEWEKNFKPVIIDRQCLIRAPFHKTDQFYRFEIIIEPKMSFGTGHHATTNLMISEMLKSDFRNKTILDAGCGTGILAILAEKLGADSITAVDIDEWSYQNTLENSTINNCQKIKPVIGDAGKISGQIFDIILANINLNILLAGLSGFAAMLRPGGNLIMSGILSTDIHALKNETEQLDFTFEYSKVLDNWAVVRFKKK